MIKPPQPLQHAQVIGHALLGTDYVASILCVSVGGQTRHLSYMPYGHGPREQSCVSTLGFNGQWLDVLSGCYPLGNGHRLFSPFLQRFTSPDHLSPFEAGGLNAYAYCEGDPVNFQDATGMMKRSANGRAKWDNQSGQSTRTSKFRSNRSWSESSSNPEHHHPAYVAYDIPPSPTPDPDAPGPSSSAVSRPAGSAVNPGASDAIAPTASPSTLRVSQPAQTLAAETLSMTATGSSAKYPRLLLNTAPRHAIDAVKLLRQAADNLEADYSRAAQIREPRP